MFLWFYDFMLDSVILWNDGKRENIYNNQWRPFRLAE